MRRTLGAALCGVCFFSANATAAPQICTANKTFAVAVHGGEFGDRMAGEARLDIMKAALEKAREALKNGASSVDTVQDLVKTFEDSGTFNAGRGAIANAAGQVETDASIMDGNGLRSGAVASMTQIKNPVVAARLVMEANRHVLVVGDRGQDYAVKLGAETAPADYFRNTGKVTRPERPMRGKPEHGTVGAVALDRCGHLAAATSTGGFDAKVPGRVGDSPIVGAGVYAADGVAAFSSTGHGEFFIRFSAAKDAADRVRYAHRPIAKAMKEELFDVLKRAGAEGGMIGIDAHGNVAMNFNALGMFRGFATDRVFPTLAQYEGTMGTKEK
jgi:L-asparaginase / beta-aspartyl-peptidase